MAAAVAILFVSMIVLSGVLFGVQLRRIQERYDKRIENLEKKIDLLEVNRIAPGDTKAIFGKLSEHSKKQFNPKDTHKVPIRILREGSLKYIFI